MFLNYVNELKPRLNIKEHKKIHHRDSILFASIATNATRSLSPPPISPPGAFSFFNNTPRHSTSSTSNSPFFGISSSNGHGGIMTSSSTLSSNIDVNVSTSTSSNNNNSTSTNFTMPLASPRKFKVVEKSDGSLNLNIGGKEE